MSVIRLERCRSHEVDSTPRCWELHSEFETRGQLLAAIDGLLPPRSASGDIFRVVEDGEAYGVLDYLRVTATV